MNSHRELHQSNCFIWSFPFYASKLEHIFWSEFVSFKSKQVKIFLLSRDMFPSGTLWPLLCNFLKIIILAKMVLFIDVTNHMTIGILHTIGLAILPPGIHVLI